MTISKRRSLLFIPGNSPAMVQNAGLFEADSIIFDLEDAVSMDEKDAARELVKTALAELNFGVVERIVRINPLDCNLGKLDLECLSKALPDTILVPKATRETIEACDALLNEIEGDMSKQTKIIALLESAHGIEFAPDIISASNRVDGILLGAEDFTSDMEIERTALGEELTYARRRLATLAKACHIHFIDTPFTGVNDTRGLTEDCRRAVQIGATGKAAINPRQISDIHRAFTPDSKSVEWAKEVIEAWDQACSSNRGVFSLNGKMIDAPIVNRARKILMKAGLDEASASKEGLL